MAHKLHPVTILLEARRKVFAQQTGDWLIPFTYLTHAIERIGGNPGVWKIMPDEPLPRLLDRIEFAGRNTPFG
jgi:hypothetical protein